jgi:endonuclease/exonuclease/phosphatase family metal-dependent hydrolase
MKFINYLQSTRFILGLLFLFSFEVAFCSISICSWNLKDFGVSKSDNEIDFIASILNKYDVISIQEVTTSPGGAQAVAKLVDNLNRRGKSWDYAISDPTSSETGHSSERYAFIWNKKTVARIGKSWLDGFYASKIDREPYFTTFKKDGKEFTIAGFHAKPKAKIPETDIAWFKFLPVAYPTLNLIFCGDFNCPQSNTAFNPLKKLGYTTAFTGQKTSLKMKCVNNDCLASEYDHFFFDPKKNKLTKSGVEHFYRLFATIDKAREISDHLPIFMEFD